MVGLGVEVEGWDAEGMGAAGGCGMWEEWIIRFGDEIMRFYCCRLERDISIDKRQILSTTLWPSG